MPPGMLVGRGALLRLFVQLLFDAHHQRQYQPPVKYPEVCYLLKLTNGIDGKP